jgi:hypothetical protein
MKKHFQTKVLNHTKLKYTVASVQALQKQLYQLSDEQLKIESDEIRHNSILWLNHRFNFNKSQYQTLASIDITEKKKLAYELSFALENRLPIRLTYHRQSDIPQKHLCLEKSIEVKNISSYWDAGNLLICLNKDIISYTKHPTKLANKQIIDMQTFAHKTIRPIITESTRFDHLIKHHHEF